MGKGDAAFLFFPRNVPRNAHAGLYLRDQSVLVLCTCGNPKFRHNTNCCLITLQTPFAILIHAFAVDVVARLCRPLAGARGESRVARSLSERPTAESDAMGAVGERKGAYIA